MRLPDAITDALHAYRRLRPIKQRVIAASILELSDMFTGRKPLRPGYMAKPSLRAAYIHYYLPVHFLKIRRVLDELATYARIEGPALDFGCGPGTGTMAIGAGLTSEALSSGSASPGTAKEVLTSEALPAGSASSVTAKEVDVDLFDIVDEALDDADFLIRSAFPRVRPRIVRNPQRRYRLIVAAHVLAEMRDPRELRNLIDNHLEPDGHLVVVEPAMREPTRRLMEWRDALTADGLKIAAPCLGIAACPMRANADQWCHQDVPWSRPSFIDALDRATGLSKESLKYSYLVVTRTGQALADATPAHWRVVSNLHRAKGRVWAFLCGRAGPLCRCEMLTRHRGPALHDFERARRGDLLTTDPPIAGDAVRLGENAAVKRV